MNQPLAPLLFAATATAVFLLALLAAVVAGVLSRIDGATLPAALLRAGVAFGGTLTLIMALLGLVVSMLK